MPTTGVSAGVSVEWLGAVEDYARAAESPGDGPIPVLLSRRHDQAALWRRIIDSQFARVRRSVGEERLVVAWGDQALRAAQVYAAWSASSMVGCDTLDQVVAELRGCPQTNVVVLALASQLRIAAVARMSAAAHGSGKRLGFLCGRTEPGLSFSVAKALLRPSSPSSADCFDAPHHEQERNYLGAPAEIIERLTRPSLFKVIRSHGEGSHAKLPGVVICGLLDETEFPDAPEQGCSREGPRCKRGHSLGARVVFGDQIPAPVIGFACCNGFNVAAELYPSPTSIVLSFVEGWAAAIIAPARPLTVPDYVMERLYAGLANGEQLGAIVQALDELSRRSGQGNAYVLHGDPLYALPRIDTGDVRAGPSAMPWQAAVGPASASDATTLDLASLQTWLVALLRQTAQGRRLVRSIAVWLGNAEKETVGPLVVRVERIEAMILNAMKWAEAQPQPPSRLGLQRATVAIRLSVAQWDKEITRVLLGARRRIDAFDVGHYDQVRIDIQDGPPCRRCGTPLEVHRFGSGTPAEEHRIATLCRVCGPVEEYRMAGPRLIVADSPKMGKSGEAFRLRAEVQMPAGVKPVVDTLQVLIRFYDKANDCCVHEEARSIIAESQSVEFRFELPSNLGSELHSVHLVASCGFEVAYARIRFASVPVLVNRKRGAHLE